MSLGSAAPSQSASPAGSAGALRLVQVGVAGYGRTWLDTIAATPRASHVALVDVNPAHLAAARATLGPPDLPSFATLEEALRHVRADAVLCVVPPMYHEAVVLPALEAGLHVLSEKPIADTLQACHRIVHAARQSRGVMMVSQKARYHPWVRRFRQTVQSGEIGALSHVTYFYKDGRLEWGRFRHEMPDPLFVEMSIHHFDLLRALLGRDPVSVWAESWNPPWSGFKGDIVGTARFRFEGGVSVLYHATKISRGDLTSWYGDIVAEGEHGTLSLVYPRLYVTRPGARQTSPVGPQTELLAVTDPQAGQEAALAEFLDAIAQRRPPETAVEDNMKSVAMLLAAIDAAHQGRERRIADYLT